MSQQNSERDTTIADIHKTREQISEAFGGDIHAITADAQRRQALLGRETVSFVKQARPSDGAAKPQE